MPDDNSLLERGRKLLAKAEAAGVTPAEAEALIGKAAELMARYGIDRALLAAEKPGTDQLGNQIIDVPSPWSSVRAHLLGGVARAMRCQCVQLPAARGGTRIHVFGYAADLERAELLYTSLLVQMAHGLAAAEVPAMARGPGSAAGCSVTPPRSPAASAPPSSTPPRRPITNAAAAGRAPSWCSPTGPWRSAASASRPTQSPARCGSPPPAAATAMATPKASAPTSARHACPPRAVR